MSAERDGDAAGKKGEEGGSPERDSRAAAAVKEYWDVGFRAVELLVAVIAIGLVAGALNSSQVHHVNHQHIAVIYSAYSSFIIITGVLIIARALGETASWRISLGFSIIGVVMFTAAAAVLFYDWHRSYYLNARPNREYYVLLITSGVFAVIDAAVFLVHAFVTFRKEAEY